MRGPVKILTSTQATSSEFRHPGGLGFILLSNHAGGTWKLEVKTPDGDWVDADGAGGVSFSDEGYVAWYGDSHSTYRLVGGTVGAKAWLLSNAFVPGAGGLA